MSEVPGSKEPNKHVAYLKKWMTYDSEKMSEPSILSTFYGNIELLIDEFEKSSGQKLTAMRIKFHDVLERYRELMNILHPDPGIEESTERHNYSQEARILMAQDPELYKETIHKLMLEFTRLTDELLYHVDEQAEFQDMAVGSAVAPVIDGARKALEGALAIIPGRKPKDPSQGK